MHLVSASLVDCAIVIPPEYLTSFQNACFTKHVVGNNDFLIQAKPLWLQVYVWIELFFQIPFFFAAIYWLVKGDQRKAYPWILVYVIECVTTTIGSISGIYDIDGPSQEEKNKLALIYVSALVPTLFGLKVFAEINKWLQVDPVKKQQ